MNTVNLLNRKNWRAACSNLLYSLRLLTLRVAYRLHSYCNVLNSWNRVFFMEPILSQQLGFMAVDMVWTWYRTSTVGDTCEWTKRNVAEWIQCVWFVIINESDFWILLWYIRFLSRDGETLLLGTSASEECFLTQRGIWEWFLEITRDRGFYLTTSIYIRWMNYEYGAGTGRMILTREKCRPPR